jgi:flagellin-like protein
MKILKSRKALSPVVASIILIAVTVAVSIAVAAWMGALTVGFMGSSSITITDVAFQGTTGTANTINITMKNTGTKVVTIGQIKVNGNTKAFTGATTLQPGDVNKKITITMPAPGWSNGNPYKIDLFDSSGSAVGSTQQNSPGS